MIKAEVNQNHIEFVTMGERYDVLAECVVLLKCLKEKVCDKSGIGDSGELWVRLNKLALETETLKQEDSTNYDNM